MKFLIITHVIHLKKDNQYSGYAPYVREMNIWLKYVDEVVVLGSLREGAPTAIDLEYNHEKVDFVKVPDFNFIGIKNIFTSLFKLPIIMWRMFFAMKNADHIHLRCPGNMGLIGCLIQILFPKKKKTAKYAGNWDPESKQPWTYKLQKWILNNTFITQNMQALVYGDWKGQSKNIKPFFTASYSESEKEAIQKSDLNSVVKFVFIGTLVAGKNPMYAVKLVENLILKGKKVILNLYGEGIEKNILENYIKNNQLEKVVFLQGNQNSETVKKAYQDSHFVLLPSKSEGWPKAIAEGMFWGCVPVATRISCIPFMLDNGNRGVLIDMDLNKDVEQLETICNNHTEFQEKSNKASDWSRTYTLDLFDNEIKKALNYL